MRGCALSKGCLKMKVNRTTQKREIHSSFPVPQTADAGGVDFQHLLKEKAEEQGLMRLRELFSQIERQGELLSLTRTIEDLRRFKGLVRQFLDEALSQALRVEERVGSTPRGRVKVYRLVAQVDARLAQLTEEILLQQSDGLGLLEEIGEIKGLLINYFV